MSISEAPRSPAVTLPDIRDLAEHLRFSPAEGRIWMEDHRSVLLSSSAFGSLRKDIVERLGAPAGREMYTRIGYAEGSRDAGYARKLRPEQSYYDAFMAGPQAHALAGFGWVQVVTMEMEPDSGTCFGEFLVHDSIEASVQLELSGPSAEPVCWMATGYASGFTSAFAGRPILLREVECRGMGAHACRMIARPLEEWDDTEQDTQLYRPAPQVNRWTRKLRDDRPEDEDVIGISAGFNAALHLLTKAAPSRATMLFLGETGVGKEVFARLAHRLSPRCNQPFVAVNCAALPENLIESELFGVVRGAYTGATASRPGRFERAHGGTLFLDEIGALSAQAQSSLLRALQEGEVERVGDSHTRRVDVRVMAATHVDLREAVTKGEFREDLYFRIATFPVPVPPLRERRDDIPLMMERFRVRHCAVHGRRIPGFTARAVQALLAYQFPGNIRELYHRVERAVLLANDDEPIDLNHLFAGEDRPALMLSLDDRGRLRTQDSVTMRRRATEFLAAADGSSDAYASIERELLEAAVAEAKGNLSAAARRLGLTRRQIGLRLDRLRRRQA